ncbi:MAG: asparaginase [Lachnospiraceae bacterium]|nr:asparaginase [Lachnospiraceae bacterium]
MADTVMILATGGTIAGTEDKNYASGYEPGVLSVDELIKDASLSEICNIRTSQICNINSDDITSSIWIGLAKKIDELSEDDTIKGFVITHGTDTLEETAFFLKHTVKTGKPVVITGSMKPADSKETDGPLNLYDAVKVAYDDSSSGRGVIVTFAGKIYSAAFVYKAKTDDVDAFGSYPQKILGTVEKGNVSYLQTKDKSDYNGTYFDIKGISSLPKVNIYKFNVDADPEILKMMADRSDGLILEGAGAGEYSKDLIRLMEGLSIPVVICSRSVNGYVSPGDLLNKNTVAGYSFSSQKAAILLRLALTVSCDIGFLRYIFSITAG